jgi:glucokinase-like ROK family protein
MAIERELDTKKHRPIISPVMPEWLVQAIDLPSRLFIIPSEKELIDLIRKHGEQTTADLVSRTNHSRTKVTSSIESLIERHYLIENQATEYTGGRRSKTFSLNGSLGYVAGVDIGATHIHLAVADFAGKIINQHHERSLVREGPIKILGRACILLEHLLEDNNITVNELHGIGVGIPGPVEFSSGTAVSPPIMPGWDRYPIIQTMQQWFPSANVVVDNDVNVMAIGEITKGAGKNANHLIYVKIGTGIGSGIICNGEIYRGSSGCAGDIGHISVDKNGPVCHCGNKGCLEVLTSGPAIAERALSGALQGHSPILMRYYEENGGVLTSEDVGNAAREGDALSINTIRESGQMIGEVLASLVNFYNPEMIILGGGVSKLGNLLLSSVRQAVLNRSLPLSTRNLQITFSQIGEEAGVMGAVHLALDYFFSLEASNGGGRADLLP